MEQMAKSQGQRAEGIEHGAEGMERRAESKEQYIRLQMIPELGPMAV